MAPLTPIQRLQTYLGSGSKAVGEIQAGNIQAARRPETGFVQSAAGAIKGDLSHPQAADWCNASELLGGVPRRAAFCDYCA